MRERLTPYYTGGVDYFRNPAEALNAIRAAARSGCPYDAVVVDLYMPGSMHGPELIQKIFAAAPMACIVNTASLMDHEAVKLQTQSQALFDLRSSMPELDAFVQADGKRVPITYHHKGDLIKAPLDILRQIDTAQLRMRGAGEVKLAGLLAQFDAQIAPVLISDEIVHSVSEEFNTFLAGLNDILGSLKERQAPAEPGDKVAALQQRVKTAQRSYSFVAIRGSENPGRKLHELNGELVTLGPLSAEALGLREPDDLRSRELISRWQEAHAASCKRCDSELQAYRAHHAGQLDLKEIISAAAGRHDLVCPYPILVTTDPSHLLRPIIIEAFKRAQETRGCSFHVSCSTKAETCQGQHYELANRQMREAGFGPICCIKIEYPVRGKNTLPEEILGQELVYQLVEARKAGVLVWTVEEFGKEGDFRPDYFHALNLYLKIDNPSGVKAAGRLPKLEPDKELKLLYEQYQVVEGAGREKNITIIGKSLSKGLFAEERLGLYYEQDGRIYITTGNLSHLEPALVMAAYLKTQGVTLSRYFHLTPGSELQTVQAYLDFIGEYQGARLEEVTRERGSVRLRFKGSRYTSSFRLDEQELEFDGQDARFKHDVKQSPDGTLSWKMQTSQIVELRGIRIDSGHDEIFLDGYPQDEAVQRAANNFLQLGFHPAQVNAKPARDMKYIMAATCDPDG